MDPQLAELDALSRQLDEATQPIMDAIGNALANNAAIGKAAQGVVTGDLRAALRSNAHLLDSYVEPILNQLSSTHDVSQVRPQQPPPVPLLPQTTSHTYDTAAAGADRNPIPVIPPQQQQPPVPLPPDRLPVNPLPPIPVLNGGGPAPAPVPVCPPGTHLVATMEMGLDGLPHLMQACVPDAPGPAPVPPVPPPPGPLPPAPPAPPLNDCNHPLYVKFCPPDQPAGGNGKAPPGDRLPSLPAPAPQPPIQVGNWVCAQFGPVGSPAWCRNMAGVAASLTQIGQGIIGLVQQAGTIITDIPAQPPAWFTDSAGKLPFGIGDVLTGIWSGEATIWNAVVDTTKSTIQLAYAMTQCVACDQPAALLGALLARGLIRTLRGVNIGANLGFEGGIQLQFQFDQVDAVLDYIIKWLCPYSIPSPSTAIEWHKRGLLGANGDALLECYHRAGNQDPSVFSPAYRIAQGWQGDGTQKEYLYRLWDAAQQGAELYTDKEYQLYLQEQGFTQADQERLFAIRYRTYSLREIQRLMDTVGEPPDGLYHALRAEGWDDAHAKQLTQMEKVIFTRRHEAEIQGYTPSKIASQYSSAYLASKDVIFWMKQLGYTEADANQLMRVTESEDRSRELRSWAIKAQGQLTTWVERSYKQGLMSEIQAATLLESVGAGQDTVKLLLQVWTGEDQMATAATATACIKRGWESGFIPNFHATESLILVGYTPAKAASIVSGWQACRDDNQDVLKAGEIITAMGHGLLSPADALTRLIARGFAAGEAEFLIAEQQQKLDKATLTAQQRAMKLEQADAKAKNKQDQLAQHAAQVAAAKSAAAAVRLSKAAQSAAKAAAQELRRITPPAVLEKLLKAGQISQLAWSERMSCLGYTTEAIDILVAEYNLDPKATITLTDGPQDPLVPPCSPPG